MRVLFLYPNIFGMNMMPPSIGILNAVLRREGHKTAIFDTTDYTDWNDGHVISDKMKEQNLNVRPFDDSLLRQNEAHTNPIEDFSRMVQSFSPDLIALSLTEDCYPNAMKLLEGLNRKDRPRVVAGGVFPTFAPELALRLSEGLIDWVLVGEGEETLPELCRRLEAKEDVSDIPGIWFVNDDGSVKRSPLPMTVDVDKVPLPDYSFFPESRFYRPMQGKIWRMLPIETHRGCPYTCAYCNSPSQNVIYGAVGEKFFRKKKIPFVKEELLHCIENFKADSFYFWADTFMAWSDREFNEFCDMYSEIRLPFWVQTRPETVTRERFERLKEIGLLRCAFGLEHGDYHFRDKVLFRKINSDLITKQLATISDLGIPFSVNNILGFPQETRELAFQTIELNRSIKSDGMNAYSFTPFHGTPLRVMAEVLGFVNAGEIARSVMQPTMLKMPHWTRDQIEGLRRCFVIYVKMPKERWPEVRKAEELTPEGDRIWEKLRKEVIENYMQWGDRDHADDIGMVKLS